MDTYRTEEEQVEALRRWWRDNGRGTLLAAVVAVAAGFGWQGWQQHRAEQSRAASEHFEQLGEALAQPQPPGEDGDAARAAIRELAEKIKTEYGGTAYAQFAGLHLARLAVEAEDYPAAERELRAVLAKSPAAELRAITELRLARVVAAGGDPGQAARILSAAKPGGFKAAFAEARGDFLLQLGQDEQAGAAYQEALELANAAGEPIGEALRLKYLALRPIPPRAPPAPEAEDASPQEIALPDIAPPAPNAPPAQNAPTDNAPAIQPQEEQP